MSQTLLYCPLSLRELCRAGRAVIPALVDAGSLRESLGPWALAPWSCLPCLPRLAILRVDAGTGDARV